MATATSDLNSFVSELRESLPRLQAKQENNTEPRGLAATNLHADIKLRRDILDHFDRLPIGELSRADVETLLTLHHGFQHCAQSEIDRAIDPEKSEEVFACLGALADLDDRLVRLGSKKPVRGVMRGERATSD